MDDRAEITRLVIDRDWDRLYPLIYEELQRRAQASRRRQGAFPTLNTTALIHEAYLRLVDKTLDVHDRWHFFSVASRAMRLIIIDYARKKSAKVRGGDKWHVSLDDVREIAIEERSDELLALDEALSQMSKKDPRQGNIFELRYFGGLTIEETADALGISTATVKRDWRTAKAWLYREIESSL